MRALPPPACRLLHPPAGAGSFLVVACLLALAVLVGARCSGIIVLRLLILPALGILVSLRRRVCFLGALRQSIRNPRASSR